MEGIYNKNLVNEHYPEAFMVEAMRIWSLPKNKEAQLAEEANSGKYFGMIKKDGCFYQFNRTENHSYLFSRTESVKTGLLSEKLANVPHIKEALDVLPKDTLILGEIYYPGGTSKDTTSIMGCLSPEAIKKQNERGLIHYYIHDIVAFNGISLINMPAMKRYEVLEKVVKHFNLTQHSFIELAELYTENLYSLIGEALANGEEGVVLKNKDAVYSPGKKPAWSAIKCKKVDFADVICIGLEDATKKYSGTELENWEFWEDADGFKRKGKYFGTYGCEPVTKPYFFDWKTAIKLGAYDNNNELKEIGTVSSGLTDELRKDLSENPDNYIGKVVMVQCMEKDNAAKTLRHPIFKGFRDDKNTKECKLEEIF